MATTDPRTTIKNIVDAVLLVPGAILDDNGANATVLSLWEGGPEGLLYLFYGAPNVDVLLTFGEPRSRSTRWVEDEPTHYLMSYPVTVTTMDKYAAGVLRCTAPRMQYRVTYALRTTIEAAARSAVGGTPAYRLHIITDEAKHKRSGYVDIWEANHIVEYETGYP
jgi:hypothetical protein